MEKTYVYKVTLGKNRFDNNGLMLFSSKEKMCEYLDILIKRKFINQWHKIRLLQDGFSDTMITPGVCGIFQERMIID